MGLFSPRRCQICSSPLRRAYYTWQTSQGTVRVCPKCNTRLENLKSRAAFDPSKPFVFPPIQKASGTSGCGCLGLGAIIAVCAVGVLTNANKPADNPAPPANPAPSIPSSSPPSTAAKTPAPVAPAPPPPVIEQPRTPGLALKDVTIFPATIIVTQRIDIKTQSGGFGLDPGDELLVIRKQDGQYIVSHENQEYPVAPNLLDSMGVK